MRDEPTKLVVTVTGDNDVDREAVIALILKALEDYEIGVASVPSEARATVAEARRSKQSWLDISLADMHLRSRDELLTIILQEEEPKEQTATAAPELVLVEVPIAAIQLGPIRNVLSNVQLVRLRAIYAVFRLLSPDTFERWVENFCRDADPEVELKVWEHMLKTYNAFIKRDNRVNNDEIRKEVQAILLGWSTGAAGETKLLDAKQLTKLYELYGKNE